MCHNDPRAEGSPRCGQEPCLEPKEKRSLPLEWDRISLGPRLPRPGSSRNESGLLLQSLLTIQLGQRLPFPWNRSTRKRPMNTLHPHSPPLNPMTMRRCSEPPPKNPSRTLRGRSNESPLSLPSEHLPPVLHSIRSPGTRWIPWTQLPLSELLNHRVKKRRNPRGTR